MAGFWSSINHASGIKIKDLTIVFTIYSYSLRTAELGEAGLAHLSKVIPKNGTLFPFCALFQLWFMFLIAIIRLLESIYNFP